jgi:hypothetical protein
MFIADIFDSKIVDAQIEPHGPRDVLPQTGRVLYFEVAVSAQSFSLELVG